MIPCCFMRGDRYVFVHGGTLIVESTLFSLWPEPIEDEASITIFRRLTCPASATRIMMSKLAQDA